jgi:hypothetical protein
MSPVFTPITKLSRSQRSSNFVSPSRGKGRPRRGKPAAAAQTSAEQPRLRGVISTEPAVVTAAATEPDVPNQPLLSTACESETSDVVGESINELMLPTIELTQQVSDFSGPEFSVSEYSPQDTRACSTQLGSISQSN